MGYPQNAEILQAVVKDRFYKTLEEEEANRLYPQICDVKEQVQTTTTYTTFGGVPEPEQLSGAAGGATVLRQLKDYKLAVTVAEWTSGFEVPRSVIDDNPDMVADKIAEMARKGSKFMDKRLIATVLEASTAGYDAVSLFNDAHAESGTSQDNNRTSAAATGTKPTAAELESSLDENLGVLLAFTDDQGTPINEGVDDFLVLVHPQVKFLYSNVLMPTLPQVPQDATSATGRFRGKFDVKSSAYVTLTASASDRHYIFAKTPGYRAVRLCKKVDWEFVTNVGDDSSDLWRLGKTASFTGYARWEFAPWNWQVAVKHVFT